MNAVMEEVKRPGVVIEEDTDMEIVRFLNQEQSGVPLEFSAGAPISKDIRSYVIKDGLCYNMPKRLRNHIGSLKYPIYGDVEDPDSPTPGVKTSKITGYKYRFVLVPVDDPNVAVYEHLRDKLNQKVMPGAAENIMTEEKQTELMKEIETLKREKDGMIGDNKDLVFTANKLKAKIKELEKGN